MNDKTAFKKTLYLFNQESNILLQSDWEESPRPFKRFLERIEAEPAIKNYLDNCVGNHLPVDFNACEAVKTVTDSYVATLGNFSTTPKEESAQVYLILKEVVAQNIQGRSYFFYGFASGRKYADMYKGFLDKVVLRLIRNIQGHLTMMGIEMGLDSGDAVTNNISGPVQHMQINQASGGSTVNATQNNGVGMDELNVLLNAILDVAKDEISDDETLEEIKDNLELVRTQIESGDPKRGVIKSVFGFLRGVNSGTQFTAAVAQIAEFVGQIVGFIP